MTKRWNAKTIEIRKKKVGSTAYNEALEEFCEMIYDDFCQLSKDQSLVSQTNKELTK